MLIRLGEIIKDAKEYKESTRAELVDYAGVSEEKIVENRTIPDFYTALLICHFLNIEVDWSWLRLITEIANFE